MKTIGDYVSSHDCASCVIMEFYRSICNSILPVSQSRTHKQILKSNVSINELFTINISQIMKIVAGLLYPLTRIWGHYYLDLCFITTASAGISCLHSRVNIYNIICFNFYMHISYDVVMTPMISIIFTFKMAGGRGGKHGRVDTAVLIY